MQGNTLSHCHSILRLAMMRQFYCRSGGSPSRGGHPPSTPYYGVSSGAQGGPKFTTEKADPSACRRLCSLCLYVYVCISGRTGRVQRTGGLTIHKIGEAPLISCIDVDMLNQSWPVGHDPLHVNRPMVASDEHWYASEAFWYPQSRTQCR